MILPEHVAAGLDALPATRLAKRYALGALQADRLSEIQRLTAPAQAAGASVVGARAELVGMQQIERYNPDPPRQPELVIHEEPIFEDGPFRVCRVTGFSWR